MVVWLWSADTGASGTIGELQYRKVDVSAQGTGTLVALPGAPLEEFMTVDEGTEIARLDPTPILNRLAVLDAEAKQLQAELDATVASAEFEDAKENLRIEIESERIAQQLSEQLLNLEIKYLEASVAFNRSKIQYESAERRYKVLEPYADVGFVRENGKFRIVDKQSTDSPIENNDSVRRGLVVSRVEMLALIGEIEDAEKSYIENKKLYDHIEKRAKALRAAFAKLPPPPQTDVKRLLAPVEFELAAKQAEIKEIKQQLEWLVVKAPFDGMVTNVFVHPGQAIQPGTPICTIASEESDYVLSYVRQTSSLRPQIGMKAMVRFRGSKDSIPGAIIKIGAQVEAVSAKQLFDPQTQEWGLPIAIKIAWPDEQKQEELQPRPGEIVHVRVIPDERVDLNVAGVDEDVRLSGGTLVFAVPQ